MKINFTKITNFKNTVILSAAFLAPLSAVMAGSLLEAAKSLFEQVSLMDIHGGKSTKEIMDKLNERDAAATRPATRPTTMPATTAPTSMPSEDSSKGSEKRRPASQPTSRPTTEPASTEPATTEPVAGETHDTFFNK